jgi:hypothetical protein
MQFPSRNVDFSNLGADRAAPGGETLISSRRSRQQVNISVRLLALSRLPSFLAAKKGPGHTSL